MSHCCILSSFICLTDDVGATTYFPASFTGSSSLVPAIESPTWAPVGTPGSPQYVPADLLAATGAAGPPVIVAGDSSTSQYHQQVPSQPVHVLQPYPQHVGVVAGPPPTTPHQQAQHPAGYLQQPAPVPAHLQVGHLLSAFVCNYSMTISVLDLVISILSLLLTLHREKYYRRDPVTM